MAIDLDELISERGEFFGHALPRDSSTATVLPLEPDWLALEDHLGQQRAELLNSGGSDPTDDEVGLMLRWQVKNAFEAPDDDVTPGIWFCDEQENKIVVIVCWGSGWETSRHVFGIFLNRGEAVEALRKQFILDDDPPVKNNLE
ncbi:MULTISPECIES: hypothetical protein [unclassified Bradyrhizobium]|uniref:hypothetical protein n=1 Tax=unclassified Bradyrhizobium TaxID=2631580 RepID=UPI0028E67FE5|nr:MULTISPECIES: hypothetical protein [unclassified Bradyrhizobium]